MSAKMMAWASQQTYPVELGASPKILNSFVIDPADAAAGFRIHSNGTMQGSEDFLNWAIDLGTWLISGVNSAYQVRATLLSGDEPTGDNFDEWLALSSTRTWTHTSTGMALDKSCSMLIEVRFVASGAILDTCTVNLSTHVEPDA